MDFDLKAKDDMTTESIIVSHTNSEMYFRNLSKKFDRDAIPESMDTNIDELNKVIKELNRDGFKIYNGFRLKENEPFLNTHNLVFSRMFLFVILAVIGVYFTMNLNYELAR